MYQPKHFKWSEFACKGDANSTGLEMDEVFVKKLDYLRECFSKPIIIGSGYRTSEHNARVGGVKDSAHLKGLAVDIKVSGSDAYKLLKLAFELGFKGIGVNQKGNGRFIHLDDGREIPTLWSY